MDENIIKIRSWLEENYTNERLFDWIDPDRFIKNIEPYFPSGIRIIERPPVKEARYNCFVFTFGFKDDPDFLKRPNPLWNGNNVQLLLNHILQQTDSPEYGDYIIYKNENGGITHSGIILDNRLVLSKWSDGPLVEHAILATNPLYGDNISYYKKASSSEIRKFLFEKYIDPMQGLNT